MSDNHHHGKNEIIVVKKHGGGHEGHHGGAWKIAYADFMTAMMAFFLVMWLVNAANEETKASVASYFNPIKLSDETPAKKGLEKPVDTSEGQEKKDRSQVKADEGQTVGSAAATGDDLTSSAGEEQNYSEADFFENPYSVLAEIAQEVGQQANVSAKGEGGASNSGPATGADGGEAYRDPFDPDFWTKQIQVIRAEGQETKTEAAEKTDAEKAAETQQQVAAAEPVDPSKPAEMLPATPQTAAQAQTKDQPPVPGKAQVATAVPQPRPDAAQAEEAAEQQKEAEELREAIEKQIAGISGRLAEGLEVTPSEGGMLITISDQSNTPMFNLSSAVPRREMVLAMEKIGEILKERQGDVVIRGHTDGRPFTTEGNDNWRLSSARAHSAYFMLVKGGLGEDRVKQISGFADRRLQMPDDPFADANRRIEILLEAGKG
ncbi:MotB family protein [Rhizobiales bacterium RZME27]|uniref:MotB family protein n=1 Tax=Endobacterium cereale TaxID=2663029 RepID=A0A6A8AE38_9HYPH|nr:MotB family protein [Endobacterium cereale]MEB2848425.1 MotB family protein [Endobacterium cereale]MQY48087.1 MotB family protein [Endobacterium cereale]